MHAIEGQGKALNHPGGNPVKYGYFLELHINTHI